ncbi:MAG: hypothetical protein AVDCRST_MAG93-5626 [uncultured Chloroflexia bacterium]|uniref:Uncharacterized protein n=1 Tax=uncultured Chloroflexia bacterium TaxID=1672391 RepID=A0A6J4L3R3_9CHLR|nr:MAG: hypothetical protein AVDCRST_MAG93-5626 [uncultured Chloroflexia bacterium]
MVEKRSASLSSFISDIKSYIYASSTGSLGSTPEARDSLWGCSGLGSGGRSSLRQL